MLATPQLSTHSTSLRSILSVNLAGVEKVFLLELGAQIVGRGIQSAIRLNHPQVSRIQAVLELHEDGRVKLIDGDGKGRPSTNGTAVNGSCVQDCWLASGAEIRFGKEVVANFYQLNVPSKVSKAPLIPDLGDGPTEISPLRSAL